jgi:serine/threonine protein kinase
MILSLLQDALKEIDILKRIRHKNIVNLIEILQNDETEKIYLSIYKCISSHGIC